MEHKSSHEALVKRSVEESISQPMYTLTIVIADENGNEHQTPLNNLSLYDITQTLGSSVMQAHIANNPYISFNIQKN